MFWDASKPLKAVELNYSREIENKIIKLAVRSLKVNCTVDFTLESRTESMFASTNHSKKRFQSIYHTNVDYFFP